MRLPRLYASTCLATILIVFPPLIPAVEDAEPAPGAAETGGGPDTLPSVVRLTADQLSNSGLRLYALTTIQFVPDIRLPARILELQPLLEQRAGLRSAQAELTIARSSLEVARRNRDRLAKLHQESIVATKEVIQAEAQYTAESARSQSAEARFHQMREGILQTWGADLFRILTKDQAVFDQLLARKRLLGLLSLPPGQPTPDMKQGLRVQPAGQRGEPEIATLLGPAPRTDDATQGETWYFLTPAGRLRTGMRLDASLLRTKFPVTGIALPKSSIVWYAGLPWAFVRSAEGEFTRRPVGPHQEQGDNWLVTTGFEAGEDIVVQGAQMLLSQNLKGHIPDEGDD
jgi:hypothetical protein